MFCFHHAGGVAPGTSNHWSKPVRTIRVWHSSVKASDSSSSFLRSGEFSQGLEVRFGIEAQDGQPIVLNTGDRRLAPIALKARRLRLRFGDAPPPFEIGAFLPWLDPCREIGFRFSRLESRV
jgi:hypothetical protein